MGTRTLRMTSPLGRAVSLRSSPTGSGRAATARMPSAMLSTRAGERERRSIMTGAITPRAASTSAALAARILSAWSSKAWAMASSRRFFSGHYNDNILFFFICRDLYLHRFITGKRDLQDIARLHRQFKTTFFIGNSAYSRSFNKHIGTYYSTTIFFIKNSSFHFYSIFRQNFCTFNLFGFHNCSQIINFDG